MTDYISLHRVASSQVGYFTREQAREAGYSDPLLTYHCRTGRFTREAEGVYRLRDYPEGYSDVAVAWLSLGRRAGKAVVSHETALSLLDLCDLVPRAIDVTIERERGKSRRASEGELKGVRVHSTSRFPNQSETTWRAGVEVTNVERTLVDCVIWGTESSMVAQAMKTAFKQRLTSPEQLLEAASGRDKIGAKVMMERALENAGVTANVEEVVA